jgi:hypothetical protein
VRRGFSNKEGRSKITLWALPALSIYNSLKIKVVERSGFEPLKQNRMLQPRGNLDKSTITAQ